MCLLSIKTSPWDAILITLVMTLLVLLSEASKEFPDNASSSFKVRLPEPLNLTDGTWEVGLLSLSMPDADLKLHELSDPHPAVLFETNFLVSHSKIKTAKFSTQDLSQVYSISDGVELMKAMTQLMEWKQNQAIQADAVNLRNHYRATFR